MTKFKNLLQIILWINHSNKWLCRQRIIVLESGELIFLPCRTAFQMFCFHLILSAKDALSICHRTQVMQQNILGHILEHRWPTFTVVPLGLRMRPTLHWMVSYGCALEGKTNNKLSFRMTCLLLPVFPLKNPQGWFRAYQPFQVTRLVEDDNVRGCKRQGLYLNYLGPCCCHPSPE